MNYEPDYSGVKRDKLLMNIVVAIKFTLVPAGLVLAFWYMRNHPPK